MDVERDIREFIYENFIVAQDDVSLPSTLSLTRTGIIDSLGVLELVLFLEERYEVKITEAETLPENLDTIDNIVRYLGSKLAGRVQNDPGAPRAATL